MSAYRSAAFAIFSALFLAVAVCAAERGPSLPQEREAAVKIAHLLETDPLGEATEGLRAWFSLWLKQVPDIGVPVCTDLLAPVFHWQRPEALLVYLQMAFSSAAFMLEHPQSAQDKPKVLSAGLEGALKAYASILKQRPEATLAFLDQLQQMSDQGGLPGYISQNPCEAQAPNPQEAAND